MANEISEEKKKKLRGARLNNTIVGSAAGAFLGGQLHGGASGYKGARVGAALGGIYGAVSNPRRRAEIEKLQSASFGASTAASRVFEFASKPWQEKSTAHENMRTAAAVGAGAAGIGASAYGVHSIRSLKKQYEPKKVAAAVIDEVGDRAKKVVKDYVPTFSRWGKKIGGVLKKKVFSTAASSVYHFGGKEQLKDVSTNQYANPLKTAAGYQKSYYKKDTEGRPIVADVPVMHAQVVRAAVNKAGTIRKVVNRGGSLAKDSVAVLRGKPREVDASGRKKKREWEKSWFRKGVESAAIGGGLLIGARHIKKNPGGKVDRGFRKGSEYVKRKVNSVMPDTFDMSARFSTPASRLIEFKGGWGDKVIHRVGYDGQVHVRPEKEKGGKAVAKRNAGRYTGLVGGAAVGALRGRKGMGMKQGALIGGVGGLITGSVVDNFRKNNQSRRVLNKEFSTPASSVFHFDDTAYDAGWDVRDPRGRSARVFAPGAGKRERRDKRWYEKAENERKLWKGAVAAAAVAGLAGGRAMRKGKALGKTASKAATASGGYHSRNGGVAAPSVKVDRN